MNTFLWAWVNADLFDDLASKAAMMDWVETTDLGAYYGMGIYRFALDEWEIPSLGETLGHGGLFNSLGFYWPEKNVNVMVP